MNIEEQGVDRELRADFIDESLDALQQVSSLLVALESHPDDMDAVQTIFRPVHSIKGNAAFFSMFQTKMLAHEMESVLDLVRKTALSPDSDVVGILLQGVDALCGMLERTRQDEAEVEDEAAFHTLLGMVRDLSERKRGSEESLWRDLLQIAHAEGIEGDFIELAERLARLSPAGRRALGVGKPDATAAVADTNWPESARLLSRIIDDESMVPDPEAFRRLLDDCLQGAEPHVSTKINADFDVLLRTVGLGDAVARSLFRKHLATLFAVEAMSVEAGNQSQDRAVASAKSKDNAVSLQESRSMRVSEERIDAFLGHVGELVTIGEMYGHLHAGMAQGSDVHESTAELRRINDIFDALSLSLQHSIMQIRKVSMNGLLNRVPRMVRDVAAVQGKQIDVVVEGSDLMVDKSHVDILDAPLTHIVRNAADHGIEPPADRVAAGKPEKGTILVRAEEWESDIRLIVCDDGRGVNREALRQKAIEQGIVKPTANLSDDELLNLLFASGVSTAATVSDISGRGVGMDVVRRGIDQAGGRIALETTQGEGTRITVSLPMSVTTQILDGFVVVAGGTRYVFPLKCVERCFCPQASDLVPVKGKGMCVRDGESLFRGLDLHTALDPCGAPVDWLQGSIMVLAAEGQRVALHVDALEGVRRVVLKALEGLEQGDGLLDGGAVMGDGHVALIVNVEKLLA